MHPEKVGRVICSSTGIPAGESYSSHFFLKFILIPSLQYLANILIETLVRSSFDDW